jgi:hypothetical protein
VEHRDGPAAGDEGGRDAEEVDARAAPSADEISPLTTAGAVYLTVPDLERSLAGAGLGEPGPRISGQRLRTTRLCTVNPFTVGFTHWRGASIGPSCAQSGAAAPGALTAVALKNVPLFARYV